MAAAAGGNAPEGDPAPASPGDTGFTSILHVVLDIGRALPGLLTDRLELLALELESAGVALAKVVMLVVATAVVALTAWLLLWGSIVVVVVQAGLPLAGVLCGAVVVNVVAAWLTAARARALLPRLSLPATRRHLQPRPSDRPGPRAATPTPHERSTQPAAH